MMMVIVLIIGLGVGFLGGTLLVSSSYQEQTIEKGCAEYNQQTGEWQWKEER